MTVSYRVRTLTPSQVRRGDVVCLRSGGHMMTVGDFDAMNEVAIVSWLDANGVFRSGRFSVHMLMVMDVVPNE